MSKTIIDIEKKYRYIGIENIAQAQEIFYILFPNFEVRMTYNTRFYLYLLYTFSILLSSFFSYFSEKLYRVVKFNLKMARF